MFKRRLCQILPIVFICLFTGPVNGEEKMLSLQDAVGIANEHNLDLQAARAQLEAARREIDIARSNFFPRLNIEQNIIRTDQQVNAFGLKLNQGIIDQSDFNPDLLNSPDDITDYGTSVQLQQPIYNGGKEIIGYRIAKKGTEQAEAETQIMQETILYETVKTYLNAALAREGLKVAEDALKTAKKNLEMIQHKFDQGMIIKSDLLQTQVHVAELTETEVTARHNLKLAIAKLNTILGDSPYTYYPAEKLEGGSCPKLELSELISLANDKRFELRSLAAKESVSEQQIRMAQASYYPDINAQGSYDYHGGSLMSDGSDSITIALSMKFNLFNGTGDYHRIKQATSRLKAVRKIKASKMKTVALEVEMALLKLQSAQQRLEVTTRAVNQAEAALEILTLRYHEGAAGIVDLLRTELSLANARFNRLQANHDLLLGNASLCRSIGILSIKWLEPEKCPISNSQINKSS